MVLHPADIAHAAVQELNASGLKRQQQLRNGGKSNELHTRTKRRLPGFRIRACLTMSQIPPSEVGSPMQIDFDDEVGFEGSTLLCYAAVDGRQVVCRAGMDVVAELDDRAVQSGAHIGKEEVAKSLRPYFARKIENGSFDNHEGTSVTLAVHELVSFMQGD
jgi:hypothetical protein